MVVIAWLITACLPAIFDAIHYAQEQAGYHCGHNTCQAEQADDRVAYFTLLLAAITFGLAVATGLLFIVTFALWLSTRRAIDTANRDAEKAMKQAQGHTERELRAYINVHRSFVRGFLVGRRPFVVIKLRNSGSTPAFKARCVVSTGLRASENPTDLVTEFAETDSFSIVGPGTDLVSSLPAKQAIPDGLAPLLEDGRVTFVVWGEVQYEDAFGEPRFTRFQYRVDKGDLENFARWPEAPKRIALASCSIGNEAN